MTMRHTSLFTLALALLLGASVARADSPVETQVAQLGSDDFVEREAAHQQLLKDETLTLDMLASLYNDTQMYEERQRLYDIARHHTLRLLRLQQRVADPRGAVGVSLRGLSASDAPQVGQPGALVASTLPGFPGHAFLRRDDIIIEVDAQRVPQHMSSEAAMQTIISFIQGKKANERIELTIVRGEKRLRVAFELAAYESLQQMYRTAQVNTPYGVFPIQTLEPAAETHWLTYWQRAGGEPTATPEPLNVDLSAVAPSQATDRTVVIDGLENLHIRGNAKVIIQQNGQVIELLAE